MVSMIVLDFTISGPSCRGSSRCTSIEYLPRIPNSKKTCNIERLFAGLVRFYLFLGLLIERHTLDFAAPCKAGFG